MANIHFAKVNLSGVSERILREHGFLDKILSELMVAIEKSGDKHVSHKRRKDIDFKFIDIEVRKVERVIFGILAKTEKALDVAIAPEDKTEIVNLHDAIVDQSAFYFDLKNEEVGFVPADKIKAHEFAEYFGALVTVCLPSAGVANLQLKFDSREFDERVEDMEVITKFSATLVPQNGILDKELEELVDTFWDSNSNEMKVGLSAPKEESLIYRAKLIQKIVKYIKRGYGKLKLKGFRFDKNPITIDTSKQMLITQSISKMNKDNPVAIYELVRERRYGGGKTEK